MTGKELLIALNDIDESYIMETQTIRRKIIFPYRLVAAAAVLLLISAFLLQPEKPQPTNKQSSTLSKTESQLVPEQDPEKTPVDEGLLISMKDIVFNELEPMDADRSKRMLDMEWQKIWNYDEVLKYYSPMLGEIYIPQGLKQAQNEESTWTYFQKPDGEMVDDTVWFGFYHDYYEDGSPKLTEQVAARKGFSVIASKTGIFHCALYLEPEDQIKIYNFNGIKITFGHRQLPYGPYNPETHEPSGYYDQYTARFTMGNADYEIATEQLEPIEIVRIAASLACEGKGFVIEE